MKRPPKQNQQNPEERSQNLVNIEVDRAFSRAAVKRMENQKEFELWEKKRCLAAAKREKQIEAEQKRHVAFSERLTRDVFRPLKDYFLKTFGEHKPYGTEDGFRASVDGNVLTISSITNHWREKAKVKAYASQGKLYVERFGDMVDHQDRGYPFEISPADLVHSVGRFAADYASVNDLQKVKFSGRRFRPLR